MQIEFKFVEQTFKVRDQEITFTEKIAYDENGEEVYHRETEMENDIKLYDIYKQRSGLLTTTELKELREKHNLSQKELADKIYKLKFLLGTSCCIGNPLNIGISTCILIFSAENICTRN
jgi:DNA-binding transcriptional regulator YiaG